MITRYFLLDWFGMALGMLGLWWLGNRDRRGFIAFMLSNLIWVAIGFWISSLAMIVGNAVIFGINARGWSRWTPAD